MSRFRLPAISVFVVFWVSGCDWGWAFDGKYDPRRCDPECSGGKVCVEGRCVSTTDGGPQDDQGPKDQLIGTEEPTPTAIWRSRASVSAPKRSTGVAVLNDKIYIFGGYDGSQAVSAVEEYDPGADTWKTIGNLSAPRSPAAAVVDGTIYVIGGGDIGTVERYEPGGNTWTTMSSMPTVRQPYLAVAGGIIYAIGGYNTQSGSLSTNEAFDPLGDSWTAKAPMTARNSASAAAASGKVYVFGGEYTPPPLSLVEEYDPLADTWTQKNDMPSGRTATAAVTYGNKILLFGGFDRVSPNGGVTAIVESYDPVSDTWVQKTPMPTPRGWASVAVVKDRIFVIGGEDASGCLATVEEYSPQLDL